MERIGFIGIGGQKCASTWTYKMLGQFAGVFVSDPKELDFFSYYFDRGYEWYERHFAAAGSRLCGEVSPSYLISSDAPGRAHAYNPEMRLLLMLRDPVERSFSNHLHEVRAGHLSGANLVFETAIENNPLYLDQGRFAHHLGKWLDVFAPDRIHATFQEDVRLDPVVQTERLAGFLGVGMPARLLQQNANESSAYRNEAMGQFLWRIGKTARNAGLGQLAASAKQLPGLRQVREANRRDLRQEIAPMRPETAARLTEFFADDVGELARLLGRRPPWPRFAASAPVPEAAVIGS